MSGLTLLILLFNFSAVSLSKTLSPLFLIPGDGGSKLYAKLHRKYKPHSFCTLKTDYFYLLWVSPFVFLPFFDYCYHYNLQLRWVNSSAINQTGTKIKTGPFGDPSSVEYLDDTYPISLFTGYFSTIIANVTSPSFPIPYKRNENLMGIPFDFRLGLSDFDDIKKKLKNLIEQKYESSGLPVTLLAHSYGCLLTTAFLSNQSLNWRKKYIRRFISISGPYKGSIDSVRAILIGADFGVHLHQRHLFRETARTFPSTYSLFPTFGTLLSVAGVNYTHHDYDVIIKNIGSKNVASMLEMWKFYKLPNLKIPEDVELHCIYSRGIKTINFLKYKSWQEYPSYPEILYSDGDGTVGVPSLMECAKKHPKAISKEFFNVDHRGILHDPVVIDYVDGILLKP